MEQSNPHQYQEEHTQPDADAERSSVDRPRIYVASLLDYTSGVIHGAWIDAGQDVATLEAKVQVMLAASPTTAKTGEAAEAWAIHDFDGGGLHRLPLGEHESLADVPRIAQLLNDHGEPFIVLAQPAGLGDLDFLEAAVRDSFVGHWSSVEEFAEHVFDDMGASTFIENAPQHLRPFLMLDVEKMAEQMASELTILDGQAGVYIFNPNA
jgi:antirestriction protein